MIGKRISKYTITEKLGAGGMGEVFLAADAELGRTVAIKFLPAGVAQDGAALERFRREARAAAALNHPHIVTIHEIGEADGRHFIVMEHVDGETLRSLLNRGDVSIERALQITTQIADGLAKAHAADVVHRDIKPENILIDTDGRVRILDFGLAKLQGATQITQEDSTLGTVNYMSPEQTRGEPLDGRSDLFSLGVILYELVAGRRPFAAEHRAAIMYAIGSETPQPLARYNHDAGDGLQHIVDKLLQKRPDERYQSAADLLADLRRELRQSDSGVRAEWSGGAVSGAGRESSPHGWLRAPVVVAGAVVVFAAAALVVWFVTRDGGPAVDEDAGTPASAGAPAAEDKPSIAVLPLDNLSPDPTQAYFADGMTEALTASLARIGGLKVISRTSAMQYKDSDKPLPQIARELGVTKIVEGSVLHADGQVRITAQLIDAVTDEHLWANDYEREVRNIIGLQSEVARAIASAVHVALTPGEDVRLAQHRPVNPEAFRLYLLGRQEWNYRTEPHVRKAADYFREAIEIDPNFALAFAGLADVEIILADWGFVSTLEGYPRAVTFARRSLELDPMLAEPQTALAWVSYTYDWNFDRAEREFKRAIELNPNYATAHQWYGELLAALGRGEEAIAEFDIALTLDPLSPIIRSLQAFHLAAYGRVDEAKKALAELKADRPEFPPAYIHTLFIALIEGRPEEGITSWIKGMRLIEWFAPEEVQSIEDAFEQGGVDAWSAQTARVIEGRYRKSYHPASNVMLAYYFGGNFDKTFEWLERASENRETWAPMVIGHPFFAPLRNDPRYAQHVERIREGRR